MQQKYKTDHIGGTGLVKSIFKSGLQEREKSLERVILTILCKELSNEFNMYDVK